MAKNLKLKIKNTQLAKAAGLGKLKSKLSKKEKEEQPKAKPKEKREAKPVEEQTPAPRRIRAKSKSSFTAGTENVKKKKTPELEEVVPPVVEEKSDAVAEQPAIFEEPPLEPVRPPKKHIDKGDLPAEPQLAQPKKSKPRKEALGPTGRHVKDLLPKKTRTAPSKPSSDIPADVSERKEIKKGKKVREFKDLKPSKRGQTGGRFDSRSRKVIQNGDDERWRKRRPIKIDRQYQEEQVIRPTELTIRLPISIKDLAAEMKYKASELIQKLFFGGMSYTLNDLLDDETTVQYLGSELGCTIIIDTSEEERIQITGKSVREEILESDPKSLKPRPPVIAFMGHVDHGKTSLIDAIRKSSIASGEAGAITQHIGAFCCKTDVGPLTILDTPGHEAFSAMRARGAEVTDIVVLVVAGDEGLREQAIEAIHHAKDADVTIVVALNKCDKPNFNADNVYRELSENELLPEAWGGNTVTINTSATTGEGIVELLEMLALQADVLELRANPAVRARGAVLESELHKGLGSVATVLVQNGTLKRGDAVVFEQHWGRIKTMRDEHGRDLPEAAPSTPVEITGLSGIPSAGDPFIVVADEKEARSIVEVRQVGHEQHALQQRKIPTLDSLIQEDSSGKKVLKLLIRADVQGSVEAIKNSLLKIESDKAEVVIIFAGVGEISESDIQLAAASKAVIIGFHTAIESHADSLIKELGVEVSLFDVIYHAIDAVKAMMTGLLDKIEEEHDTGSASVQATFKASQLGVIAGCLVTEGVIHRNSRIRVIREKNEIWRGQISSIKRLQEDVREIKKGLECGIVLQGFNDVQIGDELQAYETVYKTQEL